jgi:hypothetical protein
MPASTAKPRPGAGATWIDAADYPALRKLFDNGATLPRADLRSRHLPARLRAGLVRGR